jgi:hypothetical protein
MKHDLNSDSYHLCTTEIGDTRYIYRTCPKKGRDVELKTTTKTNELHMWPLSGEVWPTSRSMKDSMRSSFDKGGKDTIFIHIGKPLLWGMVFEIVMHVWNFHTGNVFLDNNFVVKESNKCYHLNLISKHMIRNTTFMRCIAFNKGGKDTWLSYVLGSLYCGALFLKLSCLYGTFTPDMYSWTAISSLRKVINAII